MALFIATHNYARKEHAVGFLVATEGIARITPPRDGTITAVHVSEGQHVERGAQLLTVIGAETSNLGENIDDAKVSRLREQRDHLKDQVLPSGRSRTPKRSAWNRRSRALRPRSLHSHGSKRSRPTVSK